MSFKSWLNHFDPSEQTPINLYFIGEGIGESILVHIPNVFTMVVDCHGGKSSSSMDYLISQLGIKKIDLIVLSHLHYDHYSGIKVLLEKYQVEAFAHSYSTHWQKSILLSKEIEDKKYGESIPSETNLMALGKALGKKRREVWSHDEINCYKHLSNSSLLFNKQIFSQQMVIDCMAPLASLFDDPFYRQLDKFIEKAKESELDYLGENFFKTYNTKMNETCSVIRIRYGKSLVLLAADSENKTLKAITAAHISPNGEEIKTILVKVPHHGSDTSDAKVFFEKTTTENRKMFGVITPNVTHGLPLDSVISKYKKAGYELYKTAHSSIDFKKEDDIAPIGVVNSAIYPDGSVSMRTYGKAAKI